MGLVNLISSITSVKKGQSYFRLSILYSLYIHEMKCVVIVIKSHPLEKLCKTWFLMGRWFGGGGVYFKGPLFEC